MAEEYGYIYALTRPDGAIRYIGLTKNALKDRMHSHRTASRKMKTNVHKWMKKHYFDAQIIQLDRVPISQLRDREIFWIALARAAGVELMNLHEGGQFIPNNKGRKHSPEFAKFTSDRLQALPRTAEWGAKIAKSNLGRPSNQGQHARWHRDRGIVKPGCVYCEQKVKS